jgi:uncharacterized membrane-anchored protein
MKQRHYLWISILLPILVLFSLVMSHEYDKRHSQEVVFKISGYDPRDLLAGHYLIYRVEYGAPTPCQDPKVRPQQAIMCLKPLRALKSFSEKSSCSLSIVGYCRGQEFLAGIERFYIPATESQRLDRLVRNGEVKLVVRITPRGKASASHLLINGESFY